MLGRAPPRISRVLSYSRASRSLPLLIQAEINLTNVHFAAKYAYDFSEAAYLSITKNFLTGDFF
jgi:hypothetical protein